jgi:hypothetical protein
MEEAKRKGKSSPENEWWFSSEVSRWDSDPDLARKFTGEYIEYTDVGKKLTDIASKIKEITNSKDDPFQKNPDGSYRLDKDGNPMIDDAMRRITVKGVPAEKILNTFFSTLDENDKRQLMITGNYHYRNATKVTFQNDIISTYDTQKKALADNLSKLAVELKTNENLTSAQRAEIEAAITNGVDKINNGVFEKEAAAKIDEIGKVSNLEDFKYRTYTQKYLTGLAQDLSNQSYTEEILSNPYAQMNMEKDKFKLQRNKYIQEHNEFLMSHALRKDQFEFDKSKWKTEQDEKAAERARLAPKVSYGGLGTGAPPPTVADLNASIDATTKQIDSLKTAAGPTLFPTIKGPDDKPLTGGALLTAQQKALDELVNQYVANPTSIRDNDQRLFVEQMRGLQIKQIEQSNLYGKIVEIDKVTDAAITKELDGYGGVNFSDGTPIYSAADLYKAKATLQNFRKVTGGSGPLMPGVGIGSRPTVATDEAGYLASLPANLKTLGRTLLKENAGQQLTATEKVVVNRAQTLFGKFNDRANTIVTQGMKAQSDYLATHMPEVQVTYGTLNMDDKATAKNVEYLIGNATRFYDQFGNLDTENPNDFSPSTVSGMRAGEGAKEIRYVAERNYNGTGKLIMYDKNNNKQIIPLSQSDMVTYFPEVAAKNFMTDVKISIGNSAGRTTNLIGRENPVGTRYSGYNISGISNTQYAPRVRVDIEGAELNNGDEYDLFQVRLYAFDGKTWKHDVLNQQGHVDAAGVEAILKEIGPGTVEEILRKK